MDDESGGLVDDEQVLVLVGNFELSLLRLQAAVHLVWNLDVEDLPALKAVALGPQLTVYTDRTGHEQPLSLGSRADRRQRGNEAVEPRSCSLSGDLNSVAHVERVLAAARVNRGAS
jgi:hypothetical protein